MVDLTRKKLGKHLPKVDHRTLKLARYLMPANLPPIPAARAWSAAVQFPCGQMKNDEIGDCTIAAVGHGIQVMTANATQEITLPDATIEAAYEAVGGYVPGNPSSDNGCALLDVLNYWRKTGIGGHQIAAFVQVNTLNLDEMRAAIELFGGLYIGLGLPQTAQQQIGAVWDVPPGGASGRGALYSWGGHSCWLCDYDAESFNLITWGALQKLTVAFEQTYMDEAFVPVSVDFLNAQGVSSDGLNLEALIADAQALGKAA